MHRAIHSTTMKTTRQTSRFASAPMLKRPIIIRPNTPRYYGQTQSKENSTLALEAMASIRANADRLSWSQVRAVMASAAVPMVGFGFMDNFVMIQAGSMIDNTLGVKFGLATLTAAAMGQVFSDVSGVLFGGTVERLLSPWVKPANLTAAQQRLAIVPRLRLAGAVIGVIVGCVLGASSLLFVLDTSDSDDQEETLRKLQGVLQDMSSLDEMKGASCTMHMANSPHSLSQETVAVAGLSQANALATQCASERQVFSDANTLYVPVLSPKDDVVAVLELERESGFSSDDTDNVERMAQHLGIFMNRMQTA